MRYGRCLEATDIWAQFTSLPFYGAKHLISSYDRICGQVNVVENPTIVDFEGELILFHCAAQTTDSRKTADILCSKQ
jgi:hypothetical protein